MRRRGAGDEIDVGDVGGEGGEILFDGLVVADVGEDGVEDWELGAVGGDGEAGLGHQRQAGPAVFRVTVLPPVLGPVMISWRLAPSSSTLMGTTDWPLGFRLRSRSGWRALWRSRRLASVGASLKTLDSLRRLSLRGRWLVPTQAYFYAVVVFGEVGFGELQFQFCQGFDCGENFVGVARRCAASSPAGCGGSRLALLPAGGPVRCSARWSRAARRRRSVRWNWRRERRPGTRRFCSTFTGMTKRSPRMVISSSCTVPPSARRRR